MASSSSRSAARAWPKLHGYLRRGVVRDKVHERTREEWLSCLGIVNVNNKRIRDGLAPFTHATIMYVSAMTILCHGHSHWECATALVGRKRARHVVPSLRLSGALSGHIKRKRAHFYDRAEIYTFKHYPLPSSYVAVHLLTGLHTSPSDPIPHITLAVATKEMQIQSQHFMMHSRADTEDINTARFLGEEAFPNKYNDDKQLRDSYNKPIRARTSLLPDDEAKTFPVGYIKDPGGLEKWFVLNEHGEPLYIESEFYTEGEVRAIFYGLERPQPISPRPTNLQVGMAHLDLSETSLTGDFELVQLTLNFGKHMKKPLRCDIQKKQNLKTGWGDWEYLADVNAFECQWYDKILRCLSLPDGVERDRFLECAAE
ncbi:hypothetical protein E4U54_007807 [Claviceps lovelessii]|nr:hypothetical protein E4U54_007807 [Claviceps lovelessii]